MRRRRLGVVLAFSASLAACSSEALRAADTTVTTIAASTTTAGTTLPATTTTAAVAARVTGDLTAEQLAAELTTVEQAAAKGDATVGQRQQLLYRYMSGHPDLDEAVIAAVAADVRPHVERIVRARQFGQARAAADPNPTPPSDT